AEQERKKLGVLKTDVQLFGGFTMQGPEEESALIQELRKQYDVSEVDPSKPIRQRYDALLAVQPSSLSPENMSNFVEAVKSGQPTAIFEDPAPVPQFWGDVVGTAQPKRPPGGMAAMFGGQQQPEPKGDISQLWRLLGVEMVGDEIIWQDFNPEPRSGDIVEPEWIFIDEGLQAHGAIHPFNPDNLISSGMRQVLFLLAGSWRPDPKSMLEFTELAVTGENTGTINYSDYEQTQRSGGMLGLRRTPTREPYILVAAIKGTVSSDDDLFITEASNYDAKESQESDGEAASAAGDKSDDDDPELKAPEEHDINVVLVADIDWIAPVMFRLREMGENQDMLIDWKFQNVTLALNILDDLAGDDRFIDIRKRTRPHRILTKIEEATEDYRDNSLKEQTKFITDARRDIEQARDEFRKKIGELETRTDLDPRAKAQVLERERIRLERMRDVKIAQMEHERDRQVKQSERDLGARIRGVQDWYKFWAVVLPPIPPILLAFFVFFHRRKTEQEGVDARRLRFGRKQGHGE
ncbi:MAG TPA: hypothetical protein VGB31_06200, partial [Myxococcota bacterium]